MAEENVRCPRCGQADNCYKVSRIYFEGLSNRSVQDAARIHAVTSRAYSDAEERTLLPADADLIRRFAPPQGPKTITRPIHPDLFAVGFGLVLLLLIFQMRQSATIFTIALWILAVALLAYVLLRTRILGRYQAEQDEKARKTDASRRAIDRWMNTYYCIRDEIVFEPGGDETASLEDIGAFLHTGRAKENERPESII